MGVRFGYMKAMRAMNRGISVAAEAERSREASHQARLPAASGMA